MHACVLRVCAWATHDDLFVYFIVDLLFFSRFFFFDRRVIARVCLRACCMDYSRWSIHLIRGLFMNVHSLHWRTIHHGPFVHFVVNCLFFFLFHDFFCFWQGLCMRAYLRACVMHAIVCAHVCMGSSC